MTNPIFGYTRLWSCFMFIFNQINFNSSVQIHKKSAGRVENVLTSKQLKYSGGDCKCRFPSGTKGSLFRFATS